MLITEQIAQFLNGHGICAVTNFMPPEPSRMACVYASDLRTPSDPEGARVQVIFRGERADNLGLLDAAKAAAYLDGFHGLLCADGSYVINIDIESGPAAMGADNNNRCEFSLNLRVWTCD